MIDVIQIQILRPPLVISYPKKFYLNYVVPDTKTPTPVWIPIIYWIYIKTMSGIQTVVLLWFGVNFTNIFGRIFCTHRREAIWRTANSVWRISAYKFGLNFVGEIERRIFLPNALKSIFKNCLTNKVYWFSLKCVYYVWFLMLHKRIIKVSDMLNLTLMT